MKFQHRLGPVAMPPDPAAEALRQMQRPASFYERYGLGLQPFTEGPFAALPPNAQAFAAAQNMRYAPGVDTREQHPPEPPTPAEAPETMIARAYQRGPVRPGAAPAGAPAAAGAPPVVEVIGPMVDPGAALAMSALAQQFGNPVTAFQQKQQAAEKAKQDRRKALFGDAMNLFG